MGILDSMTQQAQPQQAMQEQPMQQNQNGQQGGMAQMYQMLMENSMNAIANVAQERIQQKGPIEFSC